MCIHTIYISITNNEPGKSRISQLYDITYGTQKNRTKKKTTLVITI